jgi:hypothetical protein
VCVCVGCSVKSHINKVGCRYQNRFFEVQMYAQTGKFLHNRLYRNWGVMPQQPIIKVFNHGNSKLVVEVPQGYKIARTPGDEVSR